MTRMACTEWGSEHPRAVIFLHGVGGGRRSWHAQQERANELGWRSLAWDMPGYGESPMCMPFDFEQLSNALWRMLDDAAIPQAVLVGHSMGAMVALQAWTQAPERITGLLLAASSAAFGSADGAFQNQFLAQRLAPLMAGKSMADIAHELVPRLVAPGRDGPHLNQARLSMAAVPADTYGSALRALVKFDQREALSTITVPVLCLAGAHDPAAPAQGMARMAQKIPGARYACLADAGHLLHDEQPLAFNAELEKLLKEIAP